MVRELSVKAANFTSIFADFLHNKPTVNSNIEGIVRTILNKVRLHGNQAVFEYTKHFDNATLSPQTILISTRERNAYADAAPPVVITALEQAAARIHNFHYYQKPDNSVYVDAIGVYSAYRWTPINSVGLYVPGGTASYPSSILMNAIPAQIAGVPRIVMTTPPGLLSPSVCAAARIVGIEEIYRIGGVQAIGALAYGTATIPPVDKIVGPGNAYVTEAKRQVFGQVGIDMIAGPSEIVIVTDGSNSNPDWVAADLISQAEHNPEARVILITDNHFYARAILIAIENLSPYLPRSETVYKSLDTHSLIIIVEHLRDAIPLVNKLAPEHLELAVENPEIIAAEIRNAGAIFLGYYTPETIGDYTGGPNHVLPTARNARFTSGLSVFDFLKRTTLLSCDYAALMHVGPIAMTLAEEEGLYAHRHAVAVRLGVSSLPN